jgi:hypothetical protein
MFKALKRFEFDIYREKNKAQEGSKFGIDCDKLAKLTEI